MHPNENCNCRYADVGCDKMEEVMDQISGKWKMRILFMVGRPRHPALWRAAPPAGRA